MAEPNIEIGSEGKISPEGAEAIDAFQEALMCGDLEKRKILTRNFYNLLAKIVYTSEEGDTVRYDDQTLVDLILFGKYNNTAGGLWIGTGTSGERILFSNYDPSTDSETQDKMVGWMIYPKPDSKKGLEYWERFVRHFGESSVDLRSEFRK